MTLDDVNNALAGRNESDVPLSDNYWKVLNAYRVQAQADREAENQVVEVITKDDVGELTLEDIAIPSVLATEVPLVTDSQLDSFLDDLAKG